MRDACNLPLAALTADETCPRCGCLAGRHRRHRSYVEPAVPRVGHRCDECEAKFGHYDRCSRSSISDEKRAELARLDMEKSSGLLLAKLVQQQLAQPESRAKGVPTEVAMILLRAAKDDVWDASDWIECGVAPDEVLAKIGKAGAFLAMAAWKVMREAGR